MASGSRPKGRWKSKWRKIEDVILEESSKLTGNEASQTSAANIGSSSVARPSNPNAFQFVNLTTPGQAADPNTRRFVRRHVSRQTLKQQGKSASTPPRSEARRKEGSPSSESETQITVVAHSSKDCSLCQLLQSTGYRGKCLECSALGGESITHIIHPAFATIWGTSPLAHIGNGLDDNGGMYPIEMTLEAHELIAFSHSRIFDNISIFREVWFKMVLRDPASFYQALNGVVTVLHPERKDTDHGRAYHALAVRSVNERLSNPNYVIDDGIIGAVLCFAMHNHLVQDYEKFTIHNDGLQRMIEIRGGFEALNRNMELQLMLMWSDVNGATLFDAPLRYKVPQHHIPNLIPAKAVVASQRLVSLKSRYMQFDPQAIDLIKCYDKLYIYIIVLAERSPGVWKEGPMLGLHLMSILHNFISGLDKTSVTPEQKQFADINRLAAILFLKDIRVRFMTYHLTGSHYLKRFVSLLTWNSIDWSNFQDWRLWLLIVGATNCTLEERQLFIEPILGAIKALGVHSWEEVMDILAEFGWVEEVFRPKTEQFGREVVGRGIPDYELRFKRTPV